MGRLNFHGYLISQFHPTREIHENFVHVKITCFTVLLCWRVLLYADVSLC